MLTNLLSRSIVLLAMVPLSEASKGIPYKYPHSYKISSWEPRTHSSPDVKVPWRCPCYSRPQHGLRLACKSLVSDCPSTPSGAYQNSLQVSSSCYCSLSNVSSHMKYSELSLHRWCYTMFNYSRQFGERKGLHSNGKHMSQILIPSRYLQSATGDGVTGQNYVDDAGNRQGPLHSIDF